jgi:hypothetical protein
MKHVDPEFFERNGFCRTDCKECKRLDACDIAANEMDRGEVISKGIALALAALQREEPTP